ncbi:hypothetical protein P7C70_g72, partial [Phenoliferia sp. Uapishka_3]
MSSSNPFASTSSATRVSNGPLGTLFEAASPGTPGRHMMEADARLESEESDMPPTPPRRLLDVFLQSKSPRPRSRRSTSTGSDTGRSGTDSPAPLGSRSRGEPEQEDAPPAWEFYFDPEDARPPSPGPAAPSDPLEPDPDEEMELDADDAPKENAPPALRHRRSTSLLSQPSTIPLNASPTPRTRAVSANPTDAQVSNSPVPHSSRPSLSTISISTEELDTSLENDPTASSPSSATSNPSIFPSWVETTSMNAFSEGIDHMASYDAPSLLPGFSLAFSPRKRPSLGEAGGDEKRIRRLGEDEEDE